MRRCLVLIGLMCALANQSWASCSNVSLIAKTPLEIGTIRPMHDAQGFIELDPVEGLSFSHGNAAHDNAFGEGRVTVMGMVGSTVTIGIEIVAENDHAHPSIELSEVIVRHGVEQTRIGPQGGEFRLTLPTRGTPEGIAKSSIAIGAVMRYESFHGAFNSQQVNYRLVMSCIDTAFAF